MRLISVAFHYTRTRRLSCGSGSRKSKAHSLQSFVTVGRLIVVILLMAGICDSSMMMTLQTAAITYDLG